MVLVAASLAAVLYYYDVNKFSLTGTIVGGIPKFQVPQFSWSADNETFPFNVTITDNLRVCFRRLFMDSKHHRNRHVKPSVYSTAPDIGRGNQVFVGEVQQEVCKSTVSFSSCKQFCEF